MPPDARKGAWRFDTLWKLPTHMVGSTSLTGTDLCDIMDILETAFKRDAVWRTTFPNFMDIGECGNDRPGFGVQPVSQKLVAYNIIRVLNITKIKTLLDYIIII
jgi:hypothetical protein